MNGFHGRLLRKTANEIITLTRLFNLIQGLDRKSDALPPALYKPYLHDRPSLTEAELNYMLGEYYAIRGWK